MKSESLHSDHFSQHVENVMRLLTQKNRHLYSENVGDGEEERRQERGFHNYLALEGPQDPL